MILITGGAGYIGSVLCKKLDEMGREYIAVDNLSTTKHLLIEESKFIKRDIEKIDDIIKSYNVESVVHLASYISIPESLNNPSLYFHNNYVKTLRMLEALRIADIKRIIFASSAAVYGNKTGQVKEEMVCASTNPYGATKYFIEETLKYYSHSYDFHVVSLRLFNVAGAYKDSAGFTKIVNVIPILIESIAKGKTFYIYGKNYNTKDGTPVRDYIHVLDVVESIIHALDRIDKIKYECLNIGSGIPISVKDLIYTAEKTLQVDIKYEYKPNREGDLPILYADIEKAKKILKWAPRYSLRDILKSSYEWYRYFWENRK